MEEIANELAGFLHPSIRVEVKLTATKNVLSLTGSSEGKQLIASNTRLIEAIFTLTKDPNQLAAKDCLMSLINLTADDSFCILVVRKYNLVSDLLKTVTDPKAEHADEVCMILNNLSRTAEGSGEIVKLLAEFNDGKEGGCDVSVEKLLSAFTTIGYNKAGMKLDYLASLISNLTQTKQVRSLFLDKQKAYVKLLFPFLNREIPLIRRGGAILAIRNCCFEHEHHMWLLGEEVDILPHLLLPLAGGEEFDDEDNDKLPLDLQYLPPDKVREEDVDIRKSLIEAIMMLCATKDGRAYVISKNAYVIMRELHTWETDQNNIDLLESLEQLIQILIGDEPEGGRENLMTCDIPKEHLEAIQKANINS